MYKSYKDYISSTKKQVDTNIDTKEYQKYLKRNEDVYQSISTIAREYFWYKEKYILPKKLKGLKNYIMYKWDRAVYLKNSKNEKWKTNNKSMITKILTDLVYSKLFSLDFQAYARWIKSADKNEVTKEEIQDTSDIFYNEKYDKSHVSVDENQAFLDFCIASSELKYNLWQVIYDLTAVWEWFAYVDMLHSDAKVTLDKNIGKALAEAASDADKDFIKAKYEQEYIEVSKSNAVFDYIPFSNVIYEYDKDFYKSSFVWVIEFADIHEYLDKHTYINMNEQWMHYVLNNKSHIISRDYNRVKLLSDFEDHVLWACDNKNFKNQQWLVTTIIEAENSIIESSNEINKNRVSIYSHWTPYTLTVFMNWNLVYDWINPVCEWVIPIVRLSKVNIGWVATSWWTTEVLLDIQKSFDLIGNSADDSLKSSLSPIYYTKWYANVEWLWDYIPVWDWYRIFKWDLDAINKLDLTNFDYNVLKMLDYYWNQWVMAVGLNRTSATWDWSVQQTSNNFNKLYSLSLDVLKSAIFSIWHWLTKAFKIWAMLAHTKLPPRIKAQVTWDDSTLLDAEIIISNVVSDTEIVYQPLSVNDYQYQNLVNNFTLFSNFLALNRNDPTSNVVNYDNWAIIKQFGKAVWLKWFYQTDEEYRQRKKDAIERELDIEEYKAKRMASIQGQYAPSNAPVQWQWFWQEQSQVWWNAVDTSGLVETLFNRSYDIAEDNY